VDSYNEELREAEGFVGDRASGKAFRRSSTVPSPARGERPRGSLGEQATREISKSKLDKIMLGKDLLASGLIHTAVEEFGTELAAVIRQFLCLPTW